MHTSSLHLLQSKFTSLSGIKLLLTFLPFLPAIVSIVVIYGYVLEEPQVCGLNENITKGIFIHIVMCHNNSTFVIFNSTLHY